MKRLDGSTIVVTGGGSGIGAATARRAAAEGASILIVDRDADAGRRVIEELNASGAAATFFEADLSQRSAITVVCEQLVDSHDALHGLVNNAGIVRPAT